MGGNGLGPQNLPQTPRRRRQKIQGHHRRRHAKNESTRYLPVTSFGIGPLVLRLKVPISRAAEGPSVLTSRVVSFGSLTCSAMLFHSASIAALPFTMLEPGGNAVASSV